MKREGLTFTVIFLAESANYGEGIGNISSLKKMSRGNCQEYSYISRQALRYNIVQQANWDTTPVDGKSGVVQFAPSATIEEYPEIEIQERLVDAMCAKMLDPEFNKGIEVVVLPNLYGDIVTDVAAEHQGGLGTASSSNLGNKYAMFEAIHGTAPFLINHGRGDYADPCSLIRAAGMLMGHIGYADRKAVLDKALDICTITERRKVVTTDVDGASAAEFTDYLLETIDKIK